MANDGMDGVIDDELVGEVDDSELDPGGAGEETFTDRILSELPDDMQDYARSKGFKTSEAMFKSMREAEGRATRAEQQAAQYVEALASSEPEPQYAPAQQNQQQPSLEEAAQLIGQGIENGDMDAAQGMGILARIMREELDTAVKSAVNPIMQRQTTADMEQASERIMASLGADEVRRLMPGATRLLNQDRYNNPEGIHDAIARTFMDEELRKRATQRKSRDMESTRNNASGGAASRGPSAAEQILKSIEKASVRPNDGL